MQRFGDLVMIGKGTIKVGQAFVLGTLSNVQHWTNTSSIAKPVMDMIDQVLVCIFLFNIAINYVVSCVLSVLNPVTTLKLRHMASCSIA